MYQKTQQKCKVRNLFNVGIYLYRVTQRTRKLFTSYEVNSIHCDTLQCLPKDFNEISQKKSKFEYRFPCLN